MSADSENQRNELERLLLQCTAALRDHIDARFEEALPLQGFPLAVYTWGDLSRQVQGNKALMRGTHEGRYRPYWGGGT